MNRITLATIAASAVSAALMIAAAPARADSITDYVHLELGAGVSHYNLLGDGTWVQEGMPQNSTKLSAPVLSLGFTGPIVERASWGIDWHVDYVNLGHVSSDCECTPMDENYDPKKHRLVDHPTDVPNAEFVGNGNAQGIAITLEPYVRYRGFRFGIEGGLFPYRPSWEEQIYHWQVNPNVAPQTLNVSTPHGMQLGKVLGASVSRGNFTLAYQHYFLPTRYDSAHSPAIWSGADVLMIKYRF
jgi:hypothetical protein